MCTMPPDEVGSLLAMLCLSATEITMTLTETKNMYGGGGGGGGG